MIKTKIGTRDLKAKLSEYLRRVKNGETITVTDHGKEIAQIVPVSTSLTEGFAQMLITGDADWNGQKPTLPRSRIVNTGKGLLSDLIIEDRE